MVVSMNKSKLLAVAFASAALSVSTCYAEDSMDKMEKCKVVDSKGQNIIKEHKADCAGAGGSCSGHNKANDPDAWILVPKGDCERINKGDFKDVPQEVLDKIDMPSGSK